jgi:amino acid adenylation domain-containing protein
MDNNTHENLIGLMCDHTPDLLIGLLGILKSGSGFVPIDASHPVERINYVLNDCRIEILVTQEKYLEKALRASEKNASLKHIICLDRVPDESDAEGPIKIYDCDDYAGLEPVAEINCEAQGLAYAIYTSGSTGTPKGVPISHESLVPLLLWGRDYFGLGEHTRVLQNLSYWFDFGIFEILTTVLFGGTLCFTNQNRSGSIKNYADFIREHDINTIHTTPSYLREILLTGDCFEPLRLVHLGGEQLTKTLADDIFEKVCEECEVYNGYGPTEATINSTIFELGNKTERRDTYLVNVPIGRAAAQNYLYVLDKNYQPVTVGVAGELYIGGPCLTRGYLNRPDITAALFIPHPFAEEPGARLYKTGDLVRYLPGGNLEFLGRIDHQVKVRGFRIELGEIEAVLEMHGHVRESVVMAREDTPGNQRLVAYLVPEEEQQIALAELRAFLREKLPDYMIPYAYSIMDAFPLTANGKVDRQALPAPEQLDPELTENFVTPRDPTEEVIAGICAEVLGLTRLGVHDNLFDLGCHSLLATKIVARLREAMRVELPLLSLFEAPTVAGLAESIETARLAVAGPQLPPIGQAPRDEPLPLSFAQESIWFLDQLVTGNMSYYIPRALRIKGQLKVELLEQTFSEIVRRHEILRTTFPVVDGRPVQVIHEPWTVSIPVVDLQLTEAAEREQQIRGLILQEGQKPFDLGLGPLLRLTLLRLEPSEYVLVLTEHHLVHDGWTQGVLISEFLAIYTALAEGRAPVLPELEIQYADFAYWQRQWMRGEILERQLAYWKNRLAGAPPVLELPTDRPRPAVQTFQGDEQSLDLPVNLSQELRAFSRREGVTLFMTMLAAFVALLYRYTGQADMNIGTGVANRRLREIEGLLGMIINTVALRVDASGDPTFREFLVQVREVCLEAYEHQDLPFEKLVEELQPERSLSYMPLFQVMFSFMDTPTKDLELPGLQLSPVNAHNRSAKFDLNVVIVLHAEQRIGMTDHAGHSEITALFEYSTDLFEKETIPAHSRSRRGRP